MFGPLRMDGHALSSGVFGTILQHIGVAFFGLANLDVNALRTVQDTLAVEHLIELGLDLDAICIKELAREQRTSLENVTNIYNARIVDVTSTTTPWKGRVVFKGGIRRMLEERRRRLDGDSDTTSTTSASSLSNGDFDVEFLRVEKELQHETNCLQLLKVKRERAQLEAGGAVDAPGAFTVPATGDLAAPATGAGGTTAAGAGPGYTSASGVGHIPAASADANVPVTPDAAVRKRGTAKPVKYKPKAPRTTTQAEREGLQEMVIAIREAFQRAKSRGSSDGVYHYMCLPSNRSMLPLVRHLQKNDKDYRPGTWFTGSKWFKSTYALGFRNLVGMVETQVDDFKWESWCDM